MKSLVRHSIAIVVLLAVAATMGYAKDPRRIEIRLGKDSTIFTMKLQSHPVAGQTFKVKIHVQPKQGWHIHAADEECDCSCGTPLQVSIPQLLSDYFELVNFKEIGKEISWKDSNYMTGAKVHESPYDIIAIVKAKKAVDEVPFSLFVRYFATDSQWCMPARTFAVPMTVLGEEPMKLSVLNADRSGKPMAARAKWLGSNIGR